jgi:hypothetical protein
VSVLAAPSWESRARTLSKIEQIILRLERYSKAGPTAWCGPDLTRWRVESSLDSPWLEVAFLIDLEAGTSPGGRKAP